MKQVITILIFALAWLNSCSPETVCDTAGYAAPDIQLISPEGPDIEVPADTLISFLFAFTAEAGLNTFSINGEPIHAFTNGETDAEFVLERYFWESGSLEFVLYDLCNQRTSITLNMTVIHPSY